MSAVLGAFEKVSFPELGVFDVVAKMDTGALSGAIHATSIKEVKNTDGSRAISFIPFGMGPKMQITKYERKFVKSSNGDTEMRYVIPTKIIINGETYPIKISLSDRSAMMKGVLIGRRFLRQHNFLIDSKLGHEYRYEVK